jgi:hypothetical protein
MALQTAQPRPLCVEVLGADAPDFIDVFSEHTVIATRWP